MPTVTFRNTYKGVTVGVSTRHDVRRQLGFPLWKFFYWRIRSRVIWWEPNPHHAGIHIRLSENDGKVDLIGVRIRGYKDTSGIEVGGPWSQVERLFGESIPSKSAIDQVKGVVYHSVTYKNEVDEIVFVRSLTVPE